MRHSEFQKTQLFGAALLHMWRYIEHKKIGKLTWQGSSSYMAAQRILLVQRVTFRADSSTSWLILFDIEWVQISFFFFFSFPLFINLQWERGHFHGDFQSPNLLEPSPCMLEEPPAITFVVEASPFCSFCAEGTSSLGIVSSTSWEWSYTDLIYPCRAFSASRIIVAS